MTATHRVVFLNRFYAPDVAATAQMLSDLAEDLAERGWTVTVVTSQASYEGRSKRPKSHELRNGVNVRRVLTSRFGRNTIAGRLLDYLSYFVASFVTLFRIPRPDVIVAMSDPPFILFAAVIAARLRGTRVCYWAQDVYPALAARLGVMNQDGPLFKFLAALARHLQRACDLVVGLGPGMVKALIEKGAPPDRTLFINNWADESSIRPIPPQDNWFATENHLQGKFVVLYSGNAGRGHTFDALCEVMFRFRNDDQIVFAFIGGGRKSDEIRTFVATRNVPNALFLDYLPRSDLAYSLSAACVSIVTEDPSVAGLLLPSKTYGILASGRPIVFIGADNSDVARIVQDAECGFIVAHDDPDSLERAIGEFRRDPSLLARMGEAARKSSENRYSRRTATSQWSDALMSLLANRSFDRSVYQRT